MEPVTGKVRPELTGLKQIVNQETGIPLVELSDDRELAPHFMARISLICERRFGIALKGSAHSTFGDIRRELEI